MNASSDLLHDPQPEQDALPSQTELMAREIVGLVLERCQRFLEAQDGIAKATSRITPYMTTAETVGYLRLTSIRALYQLVDRHHIPCVRRGRSLLFDVRDIDAWLRDKNARYLIAPKPDGRRRKRIA